MILTAELKFDGGFDVKRVATDFYYSLPTDADGVQEFVGRITKVPTYKTEVGCLIWGTRTHSSIGSIELANTDGGVTDWIQLNARDCECVLKLLNQGDSYDSATTVTVCIIDSVEMDEQIIRINLRGKDTLLDKPLQPLSFTAAQAAEASSIEGTPIPIAMGSLWQVEPVLTDVNDLIHQLSDSYYSEILQVLSGGSVANPPTESPDDYVLTDTGFRMLVTPSARITANMIGGTRPTNFYTGDLNLDSSWTGGTPTDWIVSLFGATITKVDGIGARIVNAQTTDAPQIEIDVASNNWYFILGEILNLESGGISITTSSGTTEYRREGRFCAIGKIEGTDNVTITGLGYTDLTLGYLHIYVFNTGAETSEMSACMLNVCARAGLKIYGSDPDIYLPSNLTTYSCGLFSKTAMSSRDALQQILDSTNGWTFTRPNGLISFGRYSLASGSSVLSVSKLNLMEYPTYKDDLAPGLSTRVAGGRNWSPYADSELAGITYPNRPPFMVDYRHIRTGAYEGTLDRAYAHALSADAMPTLIYDAVDVQTESDRISQIVTDERGFWEFTIALDSVDDVADLHPDAIVLLDDELFGADNGKIARIIAVDGEYNDPKMRITVWGAANV